MENVSKECKKNKQERTEVHHTIEQQQADVPWGCLANKAVTNGEFSLRSLFSS